LTKRKDTAEEKVSTEKGICKARMPPMAVVPPPPPQLPANAKRNEQFYDVRNNLKY